MLQKVDGKVDVQVELQLLGQRVTIPDGPGDVLLPQPEEHLLVSTVKRGKEIPLWRRHQSEARLVTRDATSPNTPESHTLPTPCCCSVAHSFLALSDPVNCSMPGFAGLHYLPELAQIQDH